MISVTLHLPTLTFFWCNTHQTDFKHRQVAKPCNAKSQSLVSPANSILQPSRLFS